MAWIQSDFQYEPPYVPCSWSDGTDAEIVEALNRHYAGNIDLTEYWSVGDVRQVTLSAMLATGVSESHAQQTVTFVLSNVGGKYLADGVTECLFQVDQVNCLNEKGYMNSSDTNSGGWKNSLRRTWCNNVYKNAIPETLRGIFKEFINQSSVGNKSSTIENTIDSFALRAEIEIRATTLHTFDGEGALVDWYSITPNQIKQVNGSVYYWWERSPDKDYNDSFGLIGTSGGASAANASYTYGIAPFGVI